MSEGASEKSSPEERVPTKSSSEERGPTKSSSEERGPTKSSSEERNPPIKISSEETYVDMSGLHLVRSFSEGRNSRRNSRYGEGRRMSEYKLPSDIPVSIVVSREAGGIVIKSVPDDTVVEEVAGLIDAVSGRDVEISGNLILKHIKSEGLSNLFGNGSRKSISEKHDDSKILSPDSIRTWQVDKPAHRLVCYDGCLSKTSRMIPALTGEETISREALKHMDVKEIYMGGKARIFLLVDLRDFFFRFRVGG